MMTKGQYRVGVDFNPSRDTTVARIKQTAADLIDLIDGIDLHGPELGELARLKSLAMTGAEEAAMWGVKAATKPPR